MMVGFWWLRRKSSVCWFLIHLANWTKGFWWKKLLALRVALNPKGKPWWLTWAKGLCRLPPFSRRCFILSTKIPFPSWWSKQHGGCIPKSNSKGLSSSPRCSTSKSCRPRWWSNYAYGYVKLSRSGRAYARWLQLTMAYCRWLLLLHESHFDSTKREPCRACLFASLCVHSLHGSTFQVLILNLLLRWS